MTAAALFFYWQKPCIYAVYSMFSFLLFSCFYAIIYTREIIDNRQTIAVKEIRGLIDGL